MGYEEQLRLGTVLVELEFLNRTQETLMVKCSAAAEDPNILELMVP